MRSNTLSWRIWPLVAAVLAILFITWDVALVSDTRQVQQRIGRQVELLGELSLLNNDLDQAAQAHRADIGSGGSDWSGWLQQLTDRSAKLQERFRDEPGMADLSTGLNLPLHAADSLHQVVLSRRGDRDAQQQAEAVFQFLMGKARKSADRTIRVVHEEGLGAQTGALSQRWDKAQVLLFLACLMAVVFSLLVGINRRLLMDSRAHGSELLLARKRLEQANKDLRETMLSKEEKEVMLKEIHHRVKNNLQIVRSLIRFQLDQVQDARVQELFHECMNRVGAMALVHEQTYLSRDLANIDVGTYLDRLVRDLVQAYNIRMRLTMDVDIQVKTLGVDTLVPLGLLINEVISNSFKHAFKEREAGTITVHLSGSEQNGLQLRIGDDGVGLVDRGRWETPRSLGMELIHTLAGQLNARVELLPVPGTMYSFDSGPVVAARKRA